MQLFWKHFNFASLEFELIPNLFEQAIFDSSQFAKGVYAENYKFLNLYIDSFLINNSKKILVWFGYLFAFFVAWLLSKFTKNRDMFEATKKKYMFSSTLNLFFLCFIPFAFTSFIEA